MHGKGTFTPETVVEFFDDFLLNEPVERIVIGMPSETKRSV